MKHKPVLHLTDANQTIMKTKIFTTTILLSVIVGRGNEGFGQTTYTLNIEPPIHDAFIDQAQPNTNFCTSPNLILGKQASGDEARVLIIWDLSSLPQSSQIINAQIRLNDIWCDPNIGGAFHRITQSWNECSVTWNNQPPTSTNYGTQTFSCGLTFTPADSILQDWVSYGNYGIMIKWQWGANGDLHVFESGNASGSDPRLIIEYICINPVSEILSVKDIKISPNPASDFFILEMELLSSVSLQIKLVNILGQVVYQENAGEVSDIYQKTIDLSGYAKGIYTMQLVTDEGMMNRKIVVE